MNSICTTCLQVQCVSRTWKLISLPVCTPAISVWKEPNAGISCAQLSVAGFILLPDLALTHTFTPRAHTHTHSLSLSLSLSPCPVLDRCGAPLVLQILVKVTLHRPQPTHKQQSHTISHRCENFSGETSRSTSVRESNPRLDGWIYVANLRKMNLRRYWTVAGEATSSSHITTGSL